MEAAEEASYKPATYMKKLEEVFPSLDTKKKDTEAPLLPKKTKSEQV